MTALLDTGFLLAVIDEGDSLHDACVAALQNENRPLLPDVVLPELAYDRRHFGLFRPKHCDFFEILP
ncbi:MAG: hypothetical protein ACREAM_00555 [Blastocatellia bacterium]